MMANQNKQQQKYTTTDEDNEDDRCGGDGHLSDF